MCYAGQAQLAQPACDPPRHPALDGRLWFPQMALYNSCATRLTQLRPYCNFRLVQDFVKAVQQESDQVASELQKILADLEPLLQERRRLEQRAKALETVMSTYQAGQAGDPIRATPAQGRHFLDVA